MLNVLETNGHNRSFLLNWKVINDRNGISLKILFDCRSIPIIYDYLQYTVMVAFCVMEVYTYLYPAIALDFLDCVESTFENNLKQLQSSY